MRGNQRTSLSLGQAQRRNMAAYDGLPPALRRWLAEAKLPWSPASARRAWRKAMWRSLGRERAALEFMDRLEEARLAQDALTIERDLAMARMRAMRPPEPGPPRGPPPGPGAPPPG
jgi:hypothetical protein